MSHWPRLARIYLSKDCKFCKNRIVLSEERCWPKREEKNSLLLLSHDVPLERTCKDWELSDHWWWEYTEDFRSSNDIE
jgi:hypothetical protein